MILILVLALAFRAQCSVIPLHYDITIIPDISALTFVSESVITILVEEETQIITLSAKNLKIQNEILVVNSTLNNTTVDFVLSNTTLVLNFEDGLAYGLYDIIVNITGEINTNLEGLYFSSYTKYNTTRPFLLTNFQDTASQVFPCFDNSTLISTFSIHLVRPNDYISLANQAKSAEVQYDDSRTKDSFATTSPIPIYFLSFAVIDFAPIHSTNSTIYAAEGDEVEFLGNISDRTVEQFYENENIRIHFLQQVVVPDYALSRDVVGNPGLVIYRESSVLYNKQRDSFEDKQEIAARVVLSVVKQWYRTVDTSLWWSNYWTAEGISFLYKYEILNQLEPSWRLQEQFLVGQLEDTLNYEKEYSIGLVRNRRPSYNEAQLFASKAFALVRMFSHLPLPGDILENPNNTIARAWTQYTTHLDVVRQSSNLKFSQKIEIPVPISIDYEDKTSSLDNFDIIFNSSALQWQLESNSSWYIINSNRLGYFRTTHDTANIRSISEFLQKSTNSNRITPLNRALLVLDVFDNVKRMQQSPEVYLDLLKYYQNETDYIAISALVKTTNELKAFLAKTNTQAKFLKFAASLIEHLYDIVGNKVVEFETHTDRLNRIQILTWLCDFNVSRCQNETNQLLTEAKTSVHPDLQEAVYCGGMRLGNYSHFGFVKNEYNKHGKDRVLRSLACTSNSTLLRYIVLAVVNDSNILTLRDEDKLPAFKAVLEKSDAGVDVALHFVKEKLEQLLISFSKREINETFLALSKKLVTVEQQAIIDEIYASLSDEQKGLYADLFSKINGIIGAKLHWRTENLRVIDSWLGGLGESTSTTQTVPPTNTTPSGATNTTTKPTTPAATTPGAAVSIYNFSLLSLSLFCALCIIL